MVGRRDGASDRDNEGRPKGGTIDGTRLRGENVAASRSRGAGPSRRVVLPGALAAIPVFLGWLLYGATTTDDVHITLWAARALARRGEILNYAGERVEQSSSLLHTLLLAGADAVTNRSLLTMAVLIGVVSVIALVVLTFRTAEALRGGAGVAAAILVATTVSVVYWAFGGLETVLAGLAFLVMLATWGRWWDAGAPLRARSVAGVVAASLPWLLVRPEAPFVAIATALGAGLIVAASRGPLSRAVRSGGLLVVVATMLGAGVVAFRMVYFRHPFPRPVSTKATGLAVRDGFAYALDRGLADPFLVVLPIVAAIAAVVWLRAGRGDTPAVLAAGSLAVVAFVVAAGGDWMPAGRLLVPAVAPAAVVVGSVAFERLPRWTPVLVGAMGLAAVVAFAARGSTGTTAWQRPVLHAVEDALTPGPAGSVAFGWAERSSRVHVRDIPAIVAMDRIVPGMVRHVDGPVVLASHQAGMVVHDAMLRHGDDLHFVDLANLTADPFESCADLLRVTAFGRIMPWEPWLANLDRCGHEPPHIVFDLGTVSELGDYEEDYRVVYRSTGQIAFPDSVLPGLGLPAETFIAVRGDLPNPLGPPVPREVPFVGLLERVGGPG